MAGQKAYYATIKDVAKLAGTSTATVSYVLNGNTERVMSPQLRQRVLDAAHELFGAEYDPEAETATE